MDQELITHRLSNEVVQFQLNRPSRRNALTNALVIELAEGLKRIAEDAAIRVAILIGDEKAFCAGADILEVNERGLDAVNDTARGAAWKSIETFPKPLIAAVQGVALGAGNELAMMADIIVAGVSARFGQPEVKIGGLAGDGGTQRLPRLIGRQRAARMLLTGEIVSAQEAYHMGLVSKFVEDADVLKSALELAQSIARNAPLSVKATKQLLRSTDEGGLEDGLRAEREALIEVFHSEDRIEGMRAFKEKRPPVWRGR